MEERDCPSVLLTDTPVSAQVSLVHSLHPEPFTLRSWGVRLVAGEPPPESLWEQLHWELSPVPPEGWQQLQSTGQQVLVVHGVPITDAPALQVWRGRATPDGRLYDQLPGAASLRGPVVRIDSLYRGHGSVSLPRHELGHALLGPSEEGAEAFARSPQEYLALLLARTPW